ncbi:NAD-dependent histone deacetylase Hst3p [Trichomonascus vanleenenianus]|uniref:NAD-dependent histone deacetylase HST4 n=1 Tax=Trichomonascus vanleenenianus TaxID=2268995 RepID=UPI003ECBA2EB
MSVEEVGAKPKRKPRLPKRSRDKKEVFDLDMFLSSEQRALETSQRYKTTADVSYERYLEVVKSGGADVKKEMSVLSHVFEQSRRLVVIAGAGISVAAGIPDFRSSTEGLFATIKEDYKLKTSGKAMFDASVYKDDDKTELFHMTIRDLHKMCVEAKPTRFHEYVNRIAANGRLTRFYTQNIDCLDTSQEHLATAVPLIGTPRGVQVHGSIRTMACSKCSWTGDLDPSKFLDGEAPDCGECLELDEVRQVAGKRLQGVGRLRPRIVLYNETNPDGEAIGKIAESDLYKRPDALVVVGTSMKIPGIRRMVKELSQAVHAAKGVVVWMNIEPPTSLGKEAEAFDFIVKGDCQLVPQLIEHYEKDKLEQLVKREENKASRQKKPSGNKITSAFKISKGIAPGKPAPVKVMPDTFDGAKIESTSTICDLSIESNTGRN